MHIAQKFEALLEIYRRPDGRKWSGQERGCDIRATRSDPIEGERLYMVECKCYGGDRQVGIAPIRAAYAAKMIENADELIVVTSTGFTRGAKTLASEQPDIELVDYHRLLDWSNKTA